MGSELKVGFLGAGKMASALARGFIKAGLVSADRVIASDPVENARAHFASEVGGKPSPHNSDVLKFADVVFLAVKPDHVADVLTEARPQFTERHLLVSIAAGVPIARIESLLGTGARIIRVMPNTPALVGASASAFAVGQAARAEDAALVQRLLLAVGVAYQVKESDRKSVV